MGNESKPAFRNSGRTTGELYNADLSTIKMKDLPTWIDHNPFQVGRIIGYGVNHPFTQTTSSPTKESQQRSDAFEAFARDAYHKYVNKPLLSAVASQGFSEGQDTSTDVSLERPLRMLVRAYVLKKAKPVSSKARVAQ